MDHEAGDSELALSRSTDAITIRRWVRKWYPRPADEELVWSLLADTIEACHANRPNGWVACAVHYGRDKHARLSILAGVAQVFVVHSRFGVFFESPPPAVHTQIAEPLHRVLAMPGVDRDDWGEPVPHPCVMVPTERLESAAADGMTLVRASIDWRIPPDPAAGTGHAINHCPALVEEVSRRTGRALSQPGYEPWSGPRWAAR